MISNRKRLKIAYLTSCNPMDKKSWSGVHYYMSRALEKFCDVFYLGPLEININKFSIIQNNKKYDHTHSLWISQKYGELFSKKLENTTYDIIFAPAASTEIAFIITNIPIVYFSDTTFKLIINYYPYFTNLTEQSIEEGNIIEQKAINKAKLLLYPSSWAANSAVNDYGADKSKVFVIPPGANLDFIPPKEVILKRKKSKNCHLLFTATNWKRKGGDIVFYTLKELAKLGMKAELTVCGCSPPKEFSHPRIEVIPFLNKNNYAEANKYYSLYYKSDFLFVPTRSECYGSIFCEASAFGLPSITTDTGGVSGVVTNNENGFMLPIEAGAVEYAKLIYRIFNNDDIYYSLVRSSRDTFEKKLNWDIWAEQACKLFYNLLYQ